MLPLLVRTVENIIKSLEPLSRAQLVGNPWNGKLVHKCLGMVLEQKVTCTHSVERKSQKDNEKYTCGPFCYTRIDVGLLKLVFLLISENPRWREDLFSDEQTASKTSLDQRDLSRNYRSRRLFPPVKVADLTRVAGVYLERSKALGRGNHSGLQEVTNAALVVNVIGLIPGTNDICKAWRGKVQRAKKLHGQSGALEVENGPFYKIHRPAVGASYCLVPVVVDNYSAWTP
ncbi:hypothetical protein EV426DRAFT_304299 [Tirmania nivea]|nr:hypothetical protein EV426DRAFT_304299 [Tirmania nivea]